MKLIKKLAVVCLSLTLAISAFKGYSVNAESKLEGWEKRGDGYFYEENPPIIDLFDFHEDSPTACDWYIVDYTGDISNKTFNPVSREMLS